MQLRLRKKVLLGMPVKFRSSKRNDSISNRMRKTSILNSISKVFFQTEIGQIIYYNKIIMFILWVLLKLR